MNPTVLRFFWKRGCASLEMARVRFWPASSRAVCLAALNRYAVDGYLEKQTVDIRRQGSTRTKEIIFFLGKRGAREIGEKRFSVSHSQIDHLLKAGDIVDALSKSNEILSYRMEHELRRAAFGRDRYAREKLFDLSVTTQSGETYIEIDSVNYTGKKLQEKASQLQNGLWVVYTRRRQIAVRRATDMPVILFENLERVRL